MKNVKKLFFALTAILCLQQPCHAGFTDTLSSWGSSALQWIQQNPRITGLFATIFTAQAVYSYRQHTTIQKQAGNIQEQVETIRKQNKTVQEKNGIIAEQADTIKSLQKELEPVIEFDNLHARLSKTQKELFQQREELSLLQEEADIIQVSNQAIKESQKLIETLESPKSTETKTFIDNLFENDLMFYTSYSNCPTRYNAMQKRLKALQKEIKISEFFSLINKNSQRLPFNKATIISLLFNSFKNNKTELFNHNQIIIHPTNTIICEYFTNIQSTWGQFFKDGIAMKSERYTTALHDAQKLNFLPLKDVKIFTLPHLPPLQIGILDHDALRNPSLKTLPKGTLIIQRYYE